MDDKNPLPVEQVIYTIGTSNREIKEFIEILKIYGIKILIDVRRFPTSQFEWFKREEFPRNLARHRIGYIFLGGRLGGFRKGGYEAYTLTKNFQMGIDKIELFALYDTVAFTCSERLPWRCHRWFIGKSLEERGWKLIHIIDKNWTWISDKRDRSNYSIITSSFY